ncbi:MAG: diguanylate cyclase [Methyloprofundus sp.]|nr:diguanylate cyclase [Methyloprofundus sp.]MDT8425387.1 diguanylate cyclase [Methyloprofundus sp.]
MGSILTLLLFSYQSNRQHEYETEIFKQYVNAQFITLAQKLESSVSVLKELNGFFKSKSSIKPDDFKLFTAGLLLSHPEIYTLEWVPAERLKTTNSTQTLTTTESTTNFSDFTDAINLHVIAAKLGFDDFPQAYTALAETKEIKSSDLDFSHMWLKLLNKVNNKHIMALISPVFVTSETNIPPFIVSFYPDQVSLIAKKNRPEKADFLGYILMLLKRDHFTQKAITFAARDLSGQSSPTNQWLVNDQDIKTQKTHTHYLESLISIDGQSWLLAAFAPSNFLENNNKIILIIGLLSSLFFALYVQILQQNHRKADNKIKIQTNQLLTIQACYRAVFNTAVDGILSINELGIISHFNPSASKIFGYTAKEVMGHNVSMLMTKEHAMNHDSYISNYLKTGIKKAIGSNREVLGLHKEGRLIPIQLSICDTGIKGKMRFTGIIRDLSALKSKEEELQEHKSKLKQHVQHTQHRTAKLKKENNHLRRLSEIDSLTKIANRRVYENRLLQEITSAKRTAQPLALLMIDIDNFKEYNDIYGHAAGDFALKWVAETVAKVLPRQTDLVARYGGEEFVVLLPATNNQGAFLVAENIRKTIQALKIKHEYSTAANVLTVSIGVSSLQGNDLNEVDLFKQADIALYSAKNKGRNQCEAYREKFPLKLIQQQI